MALGADLTAQAPPARIPKLKYRNPLPAVETSLPPETQCDIEAQISDAQGPPATPSSKAPSSDYRPSFDTASLTSPSLASTTSSLSSSNDSKSSSKKKKKGSVLGFLSLKEPSQLALEQYAEAQRKQAGERGTSTPTSRPDTSYSTKKLPSTVPKVNSKWDGVPEAIKHRHSRSNGSSKNRPSESSQDSQNSRFAALSWNGSKVSVMTDGTRNPPNSLASAAPSMSDLTIRGEDQSISPSPSTTTLPEMSYYFPEPLASDTPSVKTYQPATYHPSVAEAPPRPSESSSDFQFQPDQFSDRPDSPASTASSADTVVRDTADVIFKKLNDRPHKSIWGDATATQTPDVDAATIPESHDFLFRDQPPSETPKTDSPMASPPMSPYAPVRPVQNFSRPTPPSTSSSAPRFATMPSSYRTSRTSSGLATLYEASLADTESDETVQDDGDDEDNDAYSIAPSTVAPSVLSSRWHDSPRERLGLGGRLRMNDVLPWDDQREPPGKPKKYRLSMFSRGTSRS